jgi:hypothetical protein
MGSAPYALSVHHFSSSVGADAGFASIIGLAVLVLLFFAQARETSSLREQADQAAQRVAQLESRLAHAAAVQATPVTAAPLPAGVQPPPSSIGVVGNRPAPAIAAAVSPVPPAGVGAPPLSAATKLIPTPLPAAATAARIASGQASAVPANPSDPASPPPVNRIVTPRPATAAGGATVTNGTGEHPVVPPPLPPRTPVPIRSGRSDRMLAELTGTAESSPSDITRVLTALAAVAVVAAIVIVLLSVTSGGTSPHTAAHQSTPVSNAPNSKPRTTVAKAAPIVPSSVTVTVLNGTAVYHLANSVASQLGSDGFNQGIPPANAATQTQTSTTVEYVSGDQRDAAAVAQALKLPTSSVQPITSTTQQLGCPQGTTCNVVVTLGANSANAASSQTQTTP